LLPMKPRKRLQLRAPVSSRLLHFWSKNSTPRLPLTRQPGLLSG
jgi:hypothetical protein